MESKIVREAQSFSSRQWAGVFALFFLFYSNIIFSGVSDSNGYMISAGGAAQTCALDDKGITCWGGQWPLGFSPIYSNFANPRQISVGLSGYICALDDTGVHCWNGAGLGWDDPPGNLVNPSYVNAGYRMGCAIDEVGVKCWGEIPSEHPGAFIIPTDVVNPRQVAAGWGNACLLDDTGVRCWGSNSGGKSDVPIGLINPRQISLGIFQTCAVDDNGIACWGNGGSDGQSIVPSGLVNPRQVSAGYSHTCALDDNGVTCWGNNEFGQSSVPNNLLNPRQISAGENYTCALDDNGVICWGDNGFGQSTPPETLSFSLYKKDISHIAKQNVGMPDTVFDFFSKEVCWQCHASLALQAGLDKPVEVPPQATILADRHHQHIGTSIAGGPEQPPFPDADNDGIDDENYSCLSCHEQTLSLNDDLKLTQDFRDCQFCHIVEGATKTVHHNSLRAKEALCAECHGSVISNMDAGLPPSTSMPSITTPWGSGKLNADTSISSLAGTHPGNCDFCHNTDSNHAAGTPMPSPLGEIRVFTNEYNHHRTGVPLIEGSSKGSPCQWCHIIEWPAWYKGDPAADKAPWQMRACQRCHDTVSLHSIEADVTGDGIIPGAEMYNNGHIGNQDNCWGCHGNNSGVVVVVKDDMPIFTATVPQLDGVSAVTWKKGTEFILNLKGNGFINQGEEYNALTGAIVQTTFMPAVQLTDSNKNSIVLDAYTTEAGFLSVIIPGELGSGGYQIQVKKGNKLSNPIGAVITPVIILGPSLCIEKYRVVFLRGKHFGAYLKGSDTGTRITGDGVEPDVLYFWRDNMIAAVFYGGCPSEIKVTNIFDSVTVAPMIW